MILKKYIYQKKEVKRSNKNIESADKNNDKMLKLYIIGRSTMYNIVYKK
jgi:hypothetical protein